MFWLLYTRMATRSMKFSIIEKIFANLTCMHSFNQQLNDNSLDLR